MASLTPQAVLETALWIQLCDRKSLDVDFFPEGIRFHLPSSHLLSLYCSASHGNMMEVLCDMENQQLIKKEQRVGMWTTPRGNRLVADIIEKRYRKQARALLGQKMLQLLLHRFRTTLSEPLTDNLNKVDDNRLSFEHNEKDVSGDRMTQKLHICECCRNKFYINDGRRKYCDQCKQLYRYKKIRLRKTQDVKE